MAATICNKERSFKLLDEMFSNPTLSNRSTRNRRSLALFGIGILVGIASAVWSQVQINQLEREVSRLRGIADAEHEFVKESMIQLSETMQLNFVAVKNKISDLSIDINHALCASQWET